MLSIVSLNFAVFTVLDLIAEHVIKCYICDRITFDEGGVPVSEQNAPLSAGTYSTVARRIAMPLLHAYGMLVPRLSQLTQYQ